ncbi:thiamine pyrophosphate-binding protein [Adlercreutzia aquisgranensis]|uniref:thiamine pyrophosphate-binding protein n=1 Tax=Adlercreutzia aquisgranensis TaxID=2941323 RepID=UPI002040F896|nr:thiamine pyrophosphate-binding protein [Adlercreutzia aquisgranensis]
MIQVSDYVARYLVNRGVTHNYTVPGGGAMYLNMSFGHAEGLKNVFVQHEQAAAMAAEAHARVTGVPQLVCCTTGPGGTNTLTGVLGAWLDSIPMIVVSGQVKYASTKMASGLSVRALGDQEYDIVPVAKQMSKYAVTVTDPCTIKEHLDKAWSLATSGRPGPVWLDIPQDVQRAFVDERTLSAETSWMPSDDSQLSDDGLVAAARETLDRIRCARRPVLNAGNGIRIAGAYERFTRLVEKLGIPVVTGFDSIDAICSDSELYVGRAGIMGDRPGNWAIQNCDVLLSIGSRLSVRQVGYNVDSWAREAYVIVEDVDPEELRKPSIRVDLPVCADAGRFVDALLSEIGDSPLERKGEWVGLCSVWRRDYPVVGERHAQEKRAVNSYYFMDTLSKLVPDGTPVVTGNGSAYVVSSQAWRIKEGQRYISNSGAASMGYDLPAAIGASFAAPGKTVVCLSGDGSIQMNLQELQTIVFHKLPIKIFVINNGGYHSMRQTEGNLFPELSPIGIGPETGDLSFPEMSRIAQAYGIPYRFASRNDQVVDAIEATLAQDGVAFCELFVTKDQKFEPKSATRKLDDGTLVSPPLEDLAPFLPRDELESIMQIPLWDDAL